MSTDAEATATDESRTEAAERVSEPEARIEQLERELANTAAAGRDDEKSMVIIAVGLPMGVRGTARMIFGV